MSRQVSTLHTELEAAQAEVERLRRGEDALTRALADAEAQCTEIARRSEATVSVQQQQQAAASVELAAARETMAANERQLLNECNDARREVAGMSQKVRMAEAVLRQQQSYLHSAVSDGVAVPDPHYSNGLTTMPETASSTARPTPHNPRLDDAMLVDRVRELLERFASGTPHTGVATTPSAAGTPLTARMTTAARISAASASGVSSAPNRIRL